MIINEQKVRIKDLVAGFSDQGEGGVVAFSGHLNVRPAFQREFIYNDDQQKKVIDSILNGYPIGTFYWGQVGSTAMFELIDGQ